MVCNMRKCSARRPGEDWICTACGNANYADRAFCNMRKCRAPRGGFAGAPQMAAAMPVTPAAVQDLAGTVGLPDGLLSRPPREGDWICRHCQNMNFGDRAFCNMRKCGAPRELADWVCSCGNINYADRMVCNMRKCGAARNDIHPAVLAEISSKGLGKGAFLQAAQAAAAGIQVS
mmetsp:Transcript_46251/g.110817  ORF Transcript_46251/g.110817 Transcript_46251/m.110817 type:complete len:175 (-) Transcript_46251:94-618(-)